jgi:hypothetical protein
VGYGLYQIRNNVFIKKINPLQFMKNIKLGIIIIVIIIGIGVFFQLTNKSKSTNQNPIINPPTETISPTVTPTPSSQYSDEIRAKVRSDFINSCHTKAKYSITVCNCAADYLSKNYSDEALAKMYLEYHTSNIVPKDLETAADVCNSKK